ncbi:MAG: ROK family protein [Anaerolineae bacterium]|nr:ROK family protein [Anaerolineae bacterium]
MNWVVGIDLGGTKTAIGLINPQDQIVERVRLPTLAEEGPASIVARIGDVVDGFRTRLPAGEALTGLGICAPGPIDPINGIIVNPTNLPKFYNTPMSQLLGDRLGIAIRLEHDAKAAALGEMHFGAGRGVSSLVYIVIGTGVGAAIILDGQIIRGVRNFAGEIGHATLDPYNGERCACGSLGCVETYMSGPWLERRYHRLRPESSGVTGEQIAHLATEGDPAAAQVMNGAGEALGIAIATLAMVLDIELYIIGGSVVKAGDVLLNPARQAAPAHSFITVGPRIRIEPAALGDDGPILGGGWLARR